MAQPITDEVQTSSSLPPHPVASDPDQEYALLALARILGDIATTTSRRKQEANDAK